MILIPQFDFLTNLSLSFVIDSGLKIGNTKYSLKPLIGAPFGSLFQVETGEEVMDEGRQKDLQLLEEIIDKGLKQKLLQTIASRDKIFEEQKELCDLRKNLETLEKNGVNNLKTMVNLGSEVYMQAEVPDTRHIFMDVGLGFYVEFTRQEALDYIPKREELVKKQLEEVTKVIAEIKGRIKLAHHQIQQILNLPDENTSSYRQRAFQY
ncbi:hypothetical protein Bca101_024777 [Brassica carinata]